MTEEKSAYEELNDLKDSVKSEVREAIDNYITDNPEYSKEDIQNTIDDNGRITEIYDGCVPVYNGDIMLIGSLPEVYNHESELGPAFGGTPTPINIIAGNIYEILSQIAWEEIEDYLNELVDSEKIED